MGFSRQFAAGQSAFKAVASSIAILAIAPISVAQEQSIRSVELNLPSETLSTSLQKVSQAYGINLIAPDNLVAGKMSGPAIGTLSVEAAMEAVLQNTGLIAERRGSGAYLIQRAPEVVSDPPPESRPTVQRPAPIPEPAIQDTIIVTGEKFERSLQDTISSVSVLDGETIDDSYLTNLSQILARVPNVSGGFAIRGIPERGFGSGTGDTSQTSAIYVDGAIQSQFGAAGGLLSTWDVAQVEVFRGAQTTTHGRAALGGAVILNTVDPSFEWGGRARAAVGEFNTTQYAFAGGGPIVDDLLAFRVSADVNREEGIAEFETADGGILDNVGRTTRDQYRGKLLFTPIEGLQALLTVTRAEDSQGSNAVSGPDFFARRATRTVNRNETEVTSYVLDVSYALNDALSFTSVTSYTDLSLVVDPIEATKSLPDDGLNVNADDQTLSQELRFNYDADGRFRGIVGVYYNQFDEFSERSFGGPIMFQGISANIIGSDGYENSFENYALFGEGEFDISDRWTLTLGGRFDVEDSTRSENTSLQSVPTLPFLDNGDTSFEGDASFDAFLPKAAITYNFNEDVALSASYQRAYRPGGADIRPDNREPVEFDPEYTDNYEFAFRSVFYDGSLTLNANAFYTDYTDMQIRFAPDPEVFILRFIANAGEAELYGAELELSWRPTDQSSLYASLGTVQSEFGEFLFQGENFEGNSFPGQPDLNASFGGTYRSASGYSVTVDNIYSGSYVNGIQNDPNSRVDSFLTTNLRLGYEADNWALFAYAQNVFDQEYFTSIGRNLEDPSLSTATIGQPQTLGVALELKF